MEEPAMNVGVDWLQRQARAAQKRHWMSSAAIVVGAVIGANALVYGMGRLQGGHHPYLFFFPAAILITWLTGLRLGLLAAVSLVFCAFYFWMEPRIGTATPGRLAVYALTALGCMAIFNSGIHFVQSLLLDRHATLEQLRNDKETFEQTYSCITDAFFSLDKRWRFVVANERAAKLARTSCEELKGRVFRDVFGECLTAFEMQEFERAMRDNVPVTFEHLSKDDNCWYDIHIYPSSMGLSVFLTDVTARKQAVQRVQIQHAVTSALAHQRTLAEAAPEILKGICEATDSRVAALWVLDKAAGVLRCVEAISCPAQSADAFVAETRGRNFTLGVGLPGRVWAENTPCWISDFTQDTNFPRAAIAARENLRSGFAAPIRLGEEFFGVIEFFRELVRWPDDSLLQVIGGISLQIAQYIEARRAEEALRESEERFATLANNISQFAWIANGQGEIFWYNRRWFDYTGTTLDEVKGWGWKMAHHPDHVDRVVARIQHSWDTGEPWEDTFPLRGNDGTYRWFLSRAVPIRDANGKVVRWFGTSTDITELRETQEALRAARDDLSMANEDLESKVEERTGRLRQTVAELEALSYSIIHDLRAPLRAMHSCAQLLDREYASQLKTEGRDYIERIIESSGRMDKLIQDVLAYSRVLRTELKLEPIDTDHLVRSILKSYPHLRKPNAEIQIEGVLPMVLGNEAALTQCVSHLIGNAVKFVPHGVAPRVRIGFDEVASNCAGSSAIQSEGASRIVRLWFQDNGIGIQKDYWERIFQMFQRLDKRYKGTGIGLSIVRKAAERMGGSVGLESEPGRGSRFWIELKQIQQRPSARAVAEATGNLVLNL
jgi:PAS domain S-box-containing protein